MIYKYGIHIVDSIFVISASVFIMCIAHVLFCLFIDWDKNSAKMTTITELRLWRKAKLKSNLELIYHFIATVDARLTPVFLTMALTTEF